MRLSTQQHDQAQGTASAQHPNSNASGGFLPAFRDKARRAGPHCTHRPPSHRSTCRASCACSTIIHMRCAPWRPRAGHAQHAHAVASSLGALRARSVQGRAALQRTAAADACDPHACSRAATSARSILQRTAVNPRRDVRAALALVQCRRPPAAHQGPGRPRARAAPAQLGHRGSAPRPPFAGARAPGARAWTLGGDGPRTNIPARNASVPAPPSRPRTPSNMRHDVRLSLPPLRNILQHAVDGLGELDALNSNDRTKPSLVRTSSSARAAARGIPRQRARDAQCRSADRAGICWTTAPPAACACTLQRPVQHQVDSACATPEARVAHATPERVALARQLVPAPAQLRLAVQLLVHGRRRPADALRQQGIV